MILIGTYAFGELAHSAAAPQPQLSLRIDNDKASRAAEVMVQLIALNTSNAAVAYTPPAELAGTLHGEPRSWVVTLHTEQSSAHMLAAGQFVVIPYALTLPGDAQGRIELELIEVAALRVVMNISSSDATQSGSMATSLKQQEAEAPPALARMERTFASRFGFHEPIYFLYGDEAPAAKFQFSFKYRLVGDDSKFGALIPPFRGFYFSYTQTSLWDVGADSSPFYDTSYVPELFFEWLAPDGKRNSGWFHWVGLQTGVRHESNGQAGAESRSMNTGYVRSGMILGSLNGWHAAVIPRAFTYLSTSHQNADIKQYRGYGDLQLLLGKNDALQLSVTTRIGSRAHKGSVLVDLTQPIRIPLINLETYLQLQYFDGYGESLRTYNQKSSVWRLGFGFVR